MALRLKTNGFSKVGISIDSHVPEVHDHFRGIRAATEAVAALAHLKGGRHQDFDLDGYLQDQPSEHPGADNVRGASRRSSAEFPQLQVLRARLLQ
jgi:hypothetical protein